MLQFVDVILVIFLQMTYRPSQMQEPQHAYYRGNCQMLGFTFTQPKLHS